MADVAAVKDKVQRLLADEFGTIQVTKDGAFTLRSGSARLFVFVDSAFNDRHVIILANSLVNSDVPRSPELFEYVATNNNYIFGKLSASPQDDGTVDIYFGQSILGDSLDPEELHSLVYAVGGTIDDIDDEIQSRFGGTRFHED